MSVAVASVLGLSLDTDQVSRHVDEEGRSRLHPTVGIAGLWHRLPTWAIVMEVDAAPIRRKRQRKPGGPAIVGGVLYIKISYSQGRSRAQGIEGRALYLHATASQATLCLGLPVFSSHV